MRQQDKYNTYVDFDSPIALARRDLSAIGWPRSWGFWFGISAIANRLQIRLPVHFIYTYKGVHSSQTVLNTIIGIDSMNCIEVLSAEQAICHNKFTSINVFEDYIEQEATELYNTTHPHFVADIIHIADSRFQNIRDTNLDSNLNAGCQEALTKWYNRYVYGQKELDPFLHKMYSDSLSVIHKFAIILAVNAEQSTITIHNITKAIKMYEYCIETGKQLYCDSYNLETDKLSCAIDKIRMRILREYHSNGTPIDKCTGCTITQIKRVVGDLVDSDQIEVILKIMREIGYIKVVEKTHFNNGRPSIIYLPTEQLAESDNIGDSVAANQFDLQ